MLIRKYLHKGQTSKFFKELSDQLEAEAGRTQGMSACLVHNIDSSTMAVMDARLFFSFCYLVRAVNALKKHPARVLVSYMENEGLDDAVGIEVVLALVNFMEQDEIEPSQSFLGIPHWFEKVRAAKEEEQKLVAQEGEA